MVTIKPTDAVAWDAALRNPNAFAALDNSRGQARLFDGAGRRTSAMHYFSQANIRLGHRMQMVYEYAVSGKKQTEFLAADKVAGVIASDAKYCIIGNPVNDAGAAGFNPVYDQFNLVVKPVLETLIAAGVTPIVRTEPGQVSKAASTDFRKFYQRYNAQVKNFQKSRPYGQVLVLDTASAYLLPTTTTIALRPPTDGTHTTIPVAVIEGRMFADMMRPLVPAVPVRKVFGGETRAVGLQGFTNPGFLTVTGGQAPGTGVTYAPGTLPAGITSLACDAGLTVTVTTETNSDGTNDLVFDMTATAAGNIRCAFDFAAGFDYAGAVIDLFAECTVLAGSVNFRGPYLNCDYNHATGPAITEGWSDCFNDGSKVLVDAVNLPAGVDQGTMPSDLTEVLNFHIPMTVGAADPRNYFTPRFYHYFAGAGSAKVKWRHFAADLRQT